MTPQFDEVFYFASLQPNGSCEFQISRRQAVKMHLQSQKAFVQHNKEWSFGNVALFTAVRTSRRGECYVTDNESGKKDSAP